MPDRICPQCRTEIPAVRAAAYSNHIECSRCGACLEVTSFPRAVSVVLGLAAGAFVWWLASGGEGALAGVVPTLYAVLTFGIVTPLVLMYTASFRNAPVLPSIEPGGAAGVQGAGGHGSVHH